MKAAPRISVLMSVQDGAYLRPAVETLLAQTLRDAEFVLVDDASEPDTAALLEAYARDEPRVRLVRLRRSAGLAAALNEGLAACRAPLVARADADDEYAPERLARQAAVMDARPALGVLSCGYERIDGAGRRVGALTPVTGPRRLAFRQLFQNQLLHPGTMFRSDLIRSVGGYDPAFWTAQDSDLWARLLPLTEIDNLPDRLVRWRRHGRSVLASRGAAGAALSASVSQRLLADYLGEPVTEDAAAAAVAVWRSTGRQPPATLALGLRLLARIRAEARVRGEPSVHRDLTAKVGVSLARQAARHAHRAPLQAGRIAALATGWTHGAVR